MAAVAARDGTADPRDERLHPRPVIGFPDDFAGARLGKRRRFVGAETRDMVGDDVRIAWRKAVEQAVAIGLGQSPPGCLARHARPCRG